VNGDKSDKIADLGGSFEDLRAKLTAFVGEAQVSDFVQNTLQRIADTRPPENR
jgi:hypothetical protein